MSQMLQDVHDNTAQSRYEMKSNGDTAFATYRREGDTLFILHVETPPALRGQGIAAKVMTGALDLIRRDGMKVIPVCSYADAFMARHHEYDDLRG